MKIFLMILSFLPDIIRGVKAVEEVMASAKGSDKKAVIITSAIDAAAKVGATVDNKTVAAVGATIDSVVTQLNNAGILSKDPTTTPTT